MNEVTENTKRALLEPEWLADAENDVIEAMSADQGVRTISTFFNNGKWYTAVELDDGTGSLFKYTEWGNEVEAVEVTL